MSFGPGRGRRLGGHPRGGRRPRRRAPRWRSSGSDERRATGQRSPERRERRRLTHVSRGGRPRMVDVSDKPPPRVARWRRRSSTLEQETLSADHRRPDAKGDVLTVAEMAGVMAAKRTARADPAVPPDRPDRPRRRDHARARRRWRSHPCHGGDRRSDGRRDGGHDRGGRCRADRLRHGQGRRPQRRRSATCSCSRSRRQVRGVAPSARRRAARTPAQGRPKRQSAPDAGPVAAAARLVPRARSSSRQRRRRARDARRRERRRRSRTRLAAARLRGRAAGRRRTRWSDRRGGHATRASDCARRDAPAAPAWGRATGRRRRCTACSTTRSRASASRCAPTGGRRRRWPTCRAASPACSARRS